MSRNEDRKTVGTRTSDRLAVIVAHPIAQIAFLISCAVAVFAGVRIEFLTACLSILAITFMQMVLNRQHERERDESRRDIALHAKLDELLVSTQQARNELVGLEELETEEIEDLRDLRHRPLRRKKAAAG